MARPESRWMPLDWGDYWRDTGHLRGSGHGAYLNLIGAYWNRGAALPSNDAALEAMSKCTTKEWRAVRKDVLAFFSERDGLLHHARVDRELERAKTVYEKRREAARSTNAKRDGKRDGDRTEDREEAETLNTTTTAQTPPPHLTTTLSEGEKSASADLVDKPLKANRGTRIPSDWQPDEKDLAHATERGIGAATIPRMVEHFRDHHAAKGTITKDVSASWRTWVATHLRIHGPDKTAPAATEMKTGPNRVEWTAYYRGWLKMKVWPMTAGPAPDQAHCQCPKDVIEEVDREITLALTPPQSEANAAPAPRASVPSAPPFDPARDRPAFMNGPSPQNIGFVKPKVVA